MLTAHNLFPCSGISVLWMGKRLGQRPNNACSTKCGEFNHNALKKLLLDLPLFLVLNEILGQLSMRISCTELK